LKLAAEAWLESHCANCSLHWNFRRRLLKKLTDCAITALKCSRKIFCSRSSLNFEPCQSKVFKLECRQATVVWKKIFPKTLLSRGNWLKYSSVIPQWQFPDYQANYLRHELYLTTLFLIFGILGIFRCHIDKRWWETL
jgi:hypothetical protein